MKDGFLIKIIPPAGSAVYRIHFGRRHLIVLVVALFVAAAGMFALHRHDLSVASLDVRRMQLQRAADARKLDAIERQAQVLQQQNTASERTIEAIRRALGAQKASVHALRILPEPADVATLGQRLLRLQRASAVARLQAGRLSRLAARVLNLRRLASIAHARMLAAIPSLNPVNGGINAAFGYRTDPFPEFHKGLDLAADYGTIVHAAAAGLVASAGWDGDFGIRVDIDHGNGYHTWYCHLARIAVSAGQRVAKGAPIAAVGSTGESTGPHLHYQVMRDGVAIDPMPFLNGVPANALASLHADSRVQ